MVKTPLVESKEMKLGIAAPLMRAAVYENVALLQNVGDLALNV
jgi:hypothetical protein